MALFEVLGMVCSIVFSIGVFVVLDMVCVVWYWVCFVCGVGFGV